MNFQPELAAAVMAGTKTVTRRLTSDNPRSPWWHERCGYRVGQDIAICPGRGKHAIGRAVIQNIRRERLEWLTDDEARREGFAHRIEFESAWTAINGRYDPCAQVWRIQMVNVETETCE